MTMTFDELCRNINEDWDRSVAGGKKLPLRLYMNRYGTDKLFIHHYEDEYERHFEPLRDKVLNILEIGVGGYQSPRRGGESLKVWMDYFASSTIIGIDSESKKLDLGDRVKILKGSQADVEFLTKISGEYGQFDIIIDDGSHKQGDIFTSFTTLFPLMKDGGLYVIEDLETSYRPDYGGDPDSPPTIGLIQRLVDGIHWEFWKNRGPKPIDRLVKSVHVSKELAFIYRR